MTVTASTYQTCSLPEGTPLATVDRRSGDLTLWPAGVGVGPTLTMTVADWAALKAAADRAILAECDWLNDYSACEGINSNE